jgi:hypothetical protein
VNRDGCRKLYLKSREDEQSVEKSLRQTVATTTGGSAILLDGLEKIFNDSLMAVKITDNGLRAALVFVVDVVRPDSRYDPACIEFLFRRSQSLLHACSQKACLVLRLERILDRIEASIPGVFEEQGSPDARGFARIRAASSVAKLTLTLHKLGRNLGANAWTIAKIGACQACKGSRISMI